MTVAPVQATVSLASAAAQPWDVLVIGAGPAGSLAAHQTAKAGARVLLVEKSAFPRNKVCGGCLSAAALRTLDECGLSEALHRLNPPRLHRARLAAGGGYADLEWPAGAAISRAAFDASLVNAAVAAGAAFLPETAAEVGSASAAVREVTLRQAHRQASVPARVVLAADGLGGRSLRSQAGFAAQVAPAARVGLGALIEGATDGYDLGTVYMACGRGAYVGVVRLDRERLDVAAACDPDAFRAAGGAERLIAGVLNQAGLPEIELHEQNWRGTPLLTRRRRRTAAARLLVLGDAAAYVEPFTGEGMAWALASARSAAPLALDGLGQWDGALEARWGRVQRELFAARRRSCRWLTLALRSPWLARMAVRLLARAPRAARPFVAAMHRAAPIRP